MSNHSNRKSNNSVVRAKLSAVALTVGVALVAGACSTTPTVEATPEPPVVEVAETPEPEIVEPEPEPEIEETPAGRQLTPLEQQLAGYWKFTDCESGFLNCHYDTLIVFGEEEVTTALDGEWNLGWFGRGRLAVRWRASDDTLNIAVMPPESSDTFTFLTEFPTEDQLTLTYIFDDRVIAAAQLERVEVPEDVLAAEAEVRRNLIGTWVQPDSWNNVVFQDNVWGGEGGAGFFGAADVWVFGGGNFDIITWLGNDSDQFAIFTRLYTEVDGRQVLSSYSWFGGIVELDGDTLTLRASGDNFETLTRQTD